MKHPQKFIFKKLLQRDIKVILNKQKVLEEVRAYKRTIPTVWFWH